MKQIDVREGALRQHRTIALYCVIQCWIRGLDGVVIIRRDLERLLGLERFKQTRIDWLQEDFKEFFPFIMVQVDLDDSLYALWVSRIPIEENMIPIDKINHFSVLNLWKRPTVQELNTLYQGVAPFFADYANYDERLLSSYLALLAQGQISPNSIVAFTDNK